MAVKTPHFRVPFSVAGGDIAVVEQDSVEEIDQCVEAVLRTPVGTRIEEPEFGIPDETFEQLPPDPGAEVYLSAIAEWEPRAHVLGDARIEELWAKTVTIKREKPSG